MDQILIAVPKSRAVEIYEKLVRGAGRLENEGFSEESTVYEVAELLGKAIIEEGIDLDVSV